MSVLNDQYNIRTLDQRNERLKMLKNFPVQNLTSKCRSAIGKTLGGMLTICI